MPLSRVAGLLVLLARAFSLFYTARFGTEGLLPAIVNALKNPTTAARIGGNTTIMAAK